MIGRGSYQVLAFSLPRLEPKDLEAAARLRVRSASPVHPDKYEVFLSTHRDRHRVHIVALLVPGDIIVPLGARVGFPAVLPKSWPKNLIAVIESSGTHEIYVYQDRTLALAVQPVHSDEALKATLLALSRTYPSFAVESRSFAGLPRRDFPRFQASVPKTRDWLWAWLALIVGAGLLAGVAATHLATLQERNAAWQKWLTAQQQHGAKPSVSADQGKLRALMAKVGLPLVDVLGRLSLLWDDNVRITSFEVKGNVLQLEAESSDAVGQIAQLRTDPWFSSMSVVRIWKTVQGRDAFVIEGRIRYD